ncbi:hypothetical protein OSCI_950020 [Kamptonema sp. PCC 6506]|nr:hypothetical protein OSCI_950020 [Kamptonema sp. PCC 6506]
MLHFMPIRFDLPCYCLGELAVNQFTPKYLTLCSTRVKHSA